ncbi:MAG: bifunctional diaminohydroxyphosphoribosylaminopyrimidine deaminase/5-amino-6-(5-phosphoribosylamino)uracil reductase RibD [Bacteroidetes bacterium]|nr:bifunctional diaminohydroxyphosphoribosylaminopyrimidine deaminase/5-amino-6-(5-phosphoribosylamino)uracil reductase RibD [Bacteroidota bacterium]
MDYQFYMKRCIQLAQKALGETYPNPLVGSVIVHNDRIIGEGYHKKAGEAHAEINAINSVQNKELLKEATIFVSLEPCAHHGKTPPCANAILNYGIPIVVIGAMDPHEKVNGKGKEILENAGVTVHTGILEKECRELNKIFFTYQQKQRPYITLKWAESSDGFLDKDFSPIKISNSLTSQLVHQIRSEQQGIMVGTNTVLHDNPSLTTRLLCGNNPVRIIIDWDLKIPADYTIFNDEAPTIIFNTIKEEQNYNIHWCKIEKENAIENMMNRLFHLQIQSILVEGGAFTLQEFIRNDIWDEIIIIKNHDLKLYNGTKAPKLNIKPNKTRNIRTDLVEFYQQS